VPRVHLALAALFLAVSAMGCSTPTEEPATRSPAPPPAPAPVLSATPIRYERYPLTGASDLFALVDRFGGDGFQTILRLNRIDASHAWQGDTLVVADPMPAAEDLSPFPDRVASLRRTPKALLVSIRVQAWAAYGFGRRMHWGPTSTGRPETPTCADLYYTNWKSKERRSTDNEEWLLKWVFNFENQTGCSFHVFDLPGRPASHSCVRLLDDDAEWIYHWADQWVLTADEEKILRHGTPVVIFGEFDYDGPPPWKSLPEDPEADRLDPSEVEDAITTYASGEVLASRTRNGLRIVADLDSLPRTFEQRRLSNAVAAAGPFVLDRLDLLPRRAVLWADADRRADFDSLRTAFAASGIGVRQFLVDGYGRALRMEGIASFVSPERERLFYIESMHVPGMNADSIVWARFEGLVGARGELDDPQAPFRVILSSAQPVQAE
jgi:hypothetical protein